MNINIDIILGVIMVALVAEAMVNALKRLVTVEVEFPYQVVLSLIFSIVLCVLTGLDLIAGFGYSLMIPAVGPICSGVVASLGANAIYDLQKQLREYRARIARDELEAENGGFPEV